MKIETIYVLERMNKGNYEHIEMSATAKIEEGEDAIAAMLALKDTLHNALYGTLNKEIPNHKEINEAAKVAEEIKEEKVTKNKAKKVADVPATSPIIEEVVEVESIVSQSKEETKTKKSKVVVYDSTVPEHKSIFGGYLAKKYDTSWKTVKPAAEIKEFTASLNGKEFLDNDGKIVESFLDSVHSFFGN